MTTIMTTARAREVLIRVTMMMTRAREVRVTTHFLSFPLHRCMVSLCSAKDDNDGKGKGGSGKANNNDDGKGKDCSGKGDDNTGREARTTG
jgi:hypothetical protein